MKEKTMQTFTVGFAIFAMLFGAGNLIFPPFLGMHAGKNWLFGLAGFLLMDVIISMITLMITSKKADGVNGIVGILGDRLSKILMLALYICIGPLVAIPRTAATTYELSIIPNIPQLNSVVFSIIFFVVVLLLTIKPSKIIDVVGTVLAPILLITLAVLIIKGIINPLGTIASGDPLSTTINVGISTGYQTMDIIASLAFFIIIANQIKAYNLPSKKEENSIMKNACIVAAVALALVYGGLCYLGATVSNSYSMDLSRADIMIALAKDILGPAGLIILAVIVCAACLTTAIGLVSSCASFLEELTHKKVSYQVFAVIICVFSAVTCNFGLDNIIALAAPILNIIYPILLTLIILSVIKMSALPLVGRYGALVGTLAFVVLEFIETYISNTSLATSLPLASFGFGWVVPCITGLIIGTGLGKIVSSVQSTSENRIVAKQ